MSKNVQDSCITIIDVSAKITKSYFIYKLGFITIHVCILLILQGLIHALKYQHNIIEVSI